MSCLMFQHLNVELDAGLILSYLARVSPGVDTLHCGELEGDLLESEQVARISTQQEHNARFARIAVSDDDFGSFRRR